mgnify:CR=1 FL=1
MYKHVAACMIAALLFSGPLMAERTPSPSNAYLYIGWPNDGEVLRANHPFRVWFGLRNMGVAPKGVDMANVGHHHLLIDVDQLPDLDVPLPMTDNIRHFGKGQTEVELQLTEGEHTLQLLLADHAHIPHDPPVLSEAITITVSADAPPPVDS